MWMDTIIEQSESPPRSSLSLRRYANNKEGLR